MDDHSLSSKKLKIALNGLDRLNIVSNVAGNLWPKILAFLIKNNIKYFSIVDFACGSGDVLQSVMKKAHSRGFEPVGLGLDLNPRSVKIAEANSRNSKFQISFETSNALEFYKQDYDIVFSTLFLHHLNREEAIKLIKNMDKASKGIVIIHDLCRSFMGYILACIVPRIVSTSKIVRQDALLSVKASFSKNEIIELLDLAGIKNYKIKKTWPCRILVSWEK